MSTRQQGNRAENLVAKFLESNYDYYCYPSRGSRGIDLICLSPPFRGLPHLGIGVGRKGMSASAEFKKMRSARLFPGMILLVARKKIVRGHIEFFWHATDDGARGTDFEEALLKAKELAR